MIEAVFPQVADAFALSFGAFLARLKAARDHLDDYEQSAAKAVEAGIRRLNGEPPPHSGLGC